MHVCVYDFISHNFQIKTLTVALEEEKMKERPASNKGPQMNGPEMQLYEVQSKSYLFIQLDFPLFLHSNWTG